MSNFTCTVPQLWLLFTSLQMKCNNKMTNWTLPFTFCNVMWFSSLTCKPGIPITITLQTRELRQKVGRYLTFDKSFFFNLFYFICISVWPMCIYVYHMCVCVSEGQEKALDPLELEKMVLSHHVGAANWTWVVCKSNKCSKPQSHLPSPSIIFSKHSRWESNI